MPTNILVVGGAGYIGSHMVASLWKAGYTPIVLDNLSTGHQDAVGQTQFFHGEMSNSGLLDHIFENCAIDAVMHFASFIQVGESVQHPAKYYQNNVADTLGLLKAMLKWKIQHFIFSSSAAVYGNPLYTPIDEDHPLMPINPYGHSKYMTEKMLEDFSKAYSFQFASLRYFNAAGVDPEGKLSERHDPETHLIPLILQVARGERAYLTVFGNDYETRDGTCVRDFIHVNDLCQAHLLALQSLFLGEKRLIYNLGTGLGYTVKEVIDIAKAITQREIPIQWANRRAGDPPILIANASRAARDLHWKPLYSDLKTILEHAWFAKHVMPASF